MPKKPSEDDDFSFQDAIKGVKPIKNDRIDLYAYRENPKPFKDKTDYSEDDAVHALSDNMETQDVSGEEFIFFARPGVQLKTQKHLRQGKITVEDHLDLHGMNIEEAREVLLDFIQFSQKQQIRCIRLVHGKGYRAKNNTPVLKNMVNSWLRQHSDILAFSSAQPRDGGTGAVYILIKNI